MTNNTQSNIQDLTFEQAYAELSDLIDAMESGELPLEQSVATFERGKQLAAHCETLLENAELRVQQLNADGSLSDLG